MVAEKVEQIIARAVSDEGFRQLLISNPDEALGSFDLTSEEVNSLKKIISDGFDNAAIELGERKSRAGISVPGLFAARDSKPPEVQKPVEEVEFGGSDNLLTDFMELQKDDPSSDSPEIEGPVDLDDPSDLIPGFLSSDDPGGKPSDDSSPFDDIDTGDATGNEPPSPPSGVNIED